MTGLTIRNGHDPSGKPVVVSVHGDRVVAGPVADADVIDAAGLTVAPGLIDMQVNGAGGFDITDRPETIWEVGAVLARHGVTAFVPTVITSAPRARERALVALAGGPPAGWHGAIPLGLHFEGPMISAARKGAHPPEWLAPPAPEVVTGWSREAGVLIATIAPELPGAIEVIRALADRGVVVSVGHTESTAADVEEAVVAGARLMTHLGNAMPPMSVRAPGPLGAALGGDVLVAGVITDGVHLDRLAVRTAWRALGPSRFLTVTDTTAALGLPDGPTRLGDQDVVLEDGVVRLADGTLAGSAAALPQCLRELRTATGCTLLEVIGTATTVPANVIGDRLRGHLEPGARADITVLDDDLEPVITIVGGEVVHRREGA